MAPVVRWWGGSVDDGSVDDGPSGRRRLPATLVLVGGLLAGVVWGAFGRVWMRFISTDHEFSWSGTGFIVGAFAVVGLTAAGVFVARRAGWARRRLTLVRVVGFVCLLPLGMAAGAPLLPTVLLTPLALDDRGWSNRVRTVVAAIAVAPVVLVGSTLFADLSLGRALVGFVGMLVVYAGLVTAAGFSMARQPDGWAPPRVVRVLGPVGLGLGVIATSLLVVGFEP